MMRTKELGTTHLQGHWSDTSRVQKKPARQRASTKTLGNPPAGAESRYRTPEKKGVTTA
jgi:hypothetical protein